MIENMDITMNDKITYMTLEQRAAFLAGIDKHGEENRTDIERWIRILSGTYIE